MRISSFVLAPLSFGLYACGGLGAGSEDASTSGTAAATIGGALSGSSANGTSASVHSKTPLFNVARAFLEWIPLAQATTSCPTLLTLGANCTASAATLWLTYNACSFDGSSALWTGRLALSLGSGIMTCGTFPTLGGVNTLTRQFVTGVSTTTPSSATRVSASGTTVTLDDSTLDLANFNSDTIPTVANAGYGTQIAFDGSGARSSVTIARRIYGATFDHSVSGTLSIAETAGASTRVATGSLSVYHNKLKVVATSTFNAVTYSSSCCTPISGSVTTAFTAGSNVSPTLLGARAVGKQETLTFNGCGSGTLLGTDGTTAAVALQQCY